VSTDPSFYSTDFPVGRQSDVHFAQVGRLIHFMRINHPIFECLLRQSLCHFLSSSCSTNYSSTSITYYKTLNFVPYLHCGVSYLQITFHHLVLPFSSYSKMEDSPSNDNPEILELANLLEKIAENPYEYDNHVAYINLLGKGGDAADLRQAREVFHSLYPFSEGIPYLN
jgi:hypothetical protein